MSAMANPSRWAVTLSCTEEFLNRSRIGIPRCLKVIKTQHAVFKIP